MAASVMPTEAVELQLAADDAPHRARYTVLPRNARARGAAAAGR
jgi:hypothetical protein